MFSFIENLKPHRKCFHEKIKRKNDKLGLNCAKLGAALDKVGRSDELRCNGVTTKLVFNCF
jgi:hypothetical protein